MMPGQPIIIDFSVALLMFIRLGKSKAIPLQASAGSEGSRRLKLPDFNIIGT